MKKRIPLQILGSILAASVGLANPVHAATDQDRIAELEQKMERLLEALQQKEANIEALTRQVGKLAASRDAAPAAAPSLTRSGEEAIKAVVEEVVKKREAASPPGKWSFGGYGEIHANFSEGSVNGQSRDQLDIHRMVAMVGYEFSDWIKFQSEVELEHAFVDDGTKGELELEQAYVDFLLNDHANVRLGRVLTPVGLTNQHHEPTTFYGVERPNFDKYIIPTTWWSDGIGIFGNLAPNLGYEAYLVGGLDGSKFTSDGIRNGRIKDIPSLNDMAVAMRMDYFPFMESAASWAQHLRLGASLYHGGFNNGVEGKDPGKNGDLTIYAADFSARFGNLDLKGAAAFEKIDGAEKLTNVAEELYGYFLEAGYHILPEAWKRGRLANVDLVPFVRYDRYDTQHAMPEGVMAASGKDRQDWTFGLAFYPVPNLVLKADYQVLKADGANDPDNTINLGLGWQF